MFKQILLFFLYALISSIFGALCIWGNFSFEQALIHAQMNTLPTTLAYKMGLSALLPALIVFSITFAKPSLKKHFFILGLGILGAEFYQIRVHEYIANTFQDTKIYHDEYIDPKTILFEFPEQKRNLIILFLESVEDLPQIQKLRKIKGSLPLKGYQEQPVQNYTIAALVQNFCAIPYLYKPATSFESMQNFLSGAVCYPEILRSFGYQTRFLKAFDLDFTRTGTFLNLHGFEKALGKNELEELYHPSKEDQTEWGVTDRKLYEIAKSQILELSYSQKPFMFALITLDTHFPNEHLDKNCPKIFNDERDILTCADEMAAEFVRWIQAQDFYKNTTLVVTGDHPSYLRKSGARQIFSAFFNPVAKTLYPHAWTSLDMAPSILNSIGVKIPNNAFGLGRSLFAKDQTLFEKYGPTFEREIRKSSPEYEKLTSQKVKNNLLYARYENWGENIAETPNIQKYAPFFKEITGINYLDTLSFTLPPGSESLELRASMRLIFTQGEKKQIIIYANGQKIAAHTFWSKMPQPFEIKEKIPKQLLNQDHRLLLEFKSDALGFTPMAAGIGLLHLELWPIEN